MPALYPQAERLGCSAEVGGCMAAELPWLEGGAYEYDGGLILHGARLPEAMVVGEEAEIELYWEAGEEMGGDYVVSTRVIVPYEAGWEKLGEANSFPGLGLNPTKGWEVGAVYRDEVVVVAEGALAGPTLANVLVGVLGEEGEVGVEREGEVVGVPWVGAVVVRPREVLEVPGEGVLAEFGGWGVLRGAEWLETGEVVLWWESWQEVAADWVLFMHVVDSNGEIVAQRDGRPNHGFSPTWIWEEGDVIKDVRHVPLEADWSVLIGFYRPESGERAPVQVGGEVQANGAYRLR
ncbi:MAG TPA: hypothetical protein VLL52_05045 [Anaerolineae bacterium]|nr:hypothetical protein [Anaerolineae bacterium]